MDRSLTSALLLALVAAAAAQPTAMMPTAMMPTAMAPTTGTMAPTGMPTMMPSPTRSPTRGPTSAPVTSAARACSSGFYKRSGSCTACVSTKSTGARTTIGRSTCYNPTAAGFDKSCSPAKLQGAKIRATITKTKSVTCIPRRPRGGVVVIYLPRMGTYKLKFLTAGNYIKSSFRLNGSIPASSVRGRVISVSETFQGRKMLKISFNDKFGTLNKKAGQTIFLRGVVRRNGPLLDYCFAIPLKVCR